MKRVYIDRERTRAKEREKLIFLIKESEKYKKLLVHKNVHI